MCVELMTVGAMSGMGKTMEASVITIILTASRVSRCSHSPGAGQPWGLNGIWWAFTISSIVKGIIFLYCIPAYDAWVRNKIGDKK